MAKSKSDKRDDMDEMLERLLEQFLDAKAKGLDVRFLVDRNIKRPKKK